MMPAPCRALPIAMLATVWALALGRSQLHIILVGDSTLRYEYLSLAHWLEYGRFRMPSPERPLDLTYTRSFTDTHGRPLPSLCPYGALMILPVRYPFRTRC